jgi:prepilin-type N-terminal cleavage/methylation domain-containing protein
MGLRVPDFPITPRRRSRRRSDAFTLIELLVVMVIIVILAALLLSVLTMARSRADSAQCLSQLRQIGVGMSAYINDHDEVVPGPLSFKQSAVYTAGQAGSLPALLENYLGSTSSTAPDGVSRYSPLFECPAAKRKLRDPTKPAYIMDFLPSAAFGQCIWGDVTLNQKPLRRVAILNWGAEQTNTSNLPVPLAQIWAIQDGDQDYVTQIQGSMTTGPVSDLLPTRAHEDHWNDLFFDFHADMRRSLITVESSTPAPSGSP